MPIPSPAMLITTARNRYQTLKGGPTAIPIMKPVLTMAPITRAATVSIPPFDYLAYIDRICNGICGGWNIWRMGAGFEDVLINGPVATGGTVTGPALDALIQSQAHAQEAESRQLTQVIASTLSAAWQQVTSGMRVPGLSWYPTFAAVPSPVAPPTPNIPTPVSALLTNTNPVSKSTLKAAMLLLEPNASTEHKYVYESVAEAFEQAFQTWSITTMVTNVLGSGPVPTFAPPYVPVGPVVGGVGTMAAGGFL